MKKSVLICIALMLLVAPLFAQGAQEEQGPIVLKYWTHEDPNRTRIEERYIQEFQAANPNITIERTTQASTKMIELVQTAFAANSGPDIFNLSIEDEYQYIANGRVAAVNPQAAGYKDQKALVDTYAAGMLDPVTVGGKIYGLPLELTNWCITPRRGKKWPTFPRSWSFAMAISSFVVGSTSAIRTIWWQCCRWSNNWEVS
jgi:multiple sugar transport system substrate-binding protein